MSTVNKIAFSEIKQQVEAAFNEMAKTPFFYKEIDRDKIWEAYLSGFDDDERQEHNCNCCKSFLRQFGGLVTIVDNKVVSLWDNLKDIGQYTQAVENLKTYIHSLNVTDVFLAESKKAGTDQNLDIKRNVIWKHFFLNIPQANIKKVKDIPTLLGVSRSAKDVLKRGLEELTIDATETVLELIGQNSLYRGNEFKGMLDEFLKIQKKYSKLKADEKDNYAWTQSLKSQAVSRVRNTAIGTLLIDLSANMPLDHP